jgi:hypothetical protein
MLPFYVDSSITFLPQTFCKLIGIESKKNKCIHPFKSRGNVKEKWFSHRLIISLCGKMTIPFTNNSRILQEAIQSLPKDLGPEAVGLSRDLVKQCHTEESVDVSIYYMHLWILRLVQCAMIIFLSFSQLLVIAKTELLLRIFRKITFTGQNLK